MHQIWHRVLIDRKILISQTAGKGTFAFEGAHRAETDTYGLSGAYLIFVNFVYAQKYISLKKKYTTAGSGGSDYYELWIVAAVNNINYAHTIFWFETGKI